MRAKTGSAGFVRKQEHFEKYKALRNIRGQSVRVPFCSRNRFQFQLKDTNSPRHFWYHLADKGKKETG